MALSESFVDTYNLPPAIPNPDNSSERLYIISGYHQLHCLVSQRSMFEIKRLN